MPRNGTNTARYKHDLRSNPPVLILGTGGHARVLLSLVRLLEREVLGFLGKDEKTWAADFMGLPVFGGDDKMSEFDPDRVQIVNGIGSVGDPSARIGAFQRFKRAGFLFATLIHPSAILADDVTLGEGAQVMAGAVIQSGSRIGDNVIVNTGAIIDHECQIGDHVHLAPGVVLSGEVRIGARTHVGTAAVVIQGITIRDRALIGAGAVVVTDIPSGATAIGLPARSVFK